MERKAAKLGLARRVWCEVNEPQKCFLWRPRRESDRKEGARDFIPFDGIEKISVLEEPVHSFELLTSDGRSVVFQWRPEDDVALAGQKNGAFQWEEVLGKYLQCSQIGVLESRLSCSDIWSVSSMFNHLSLLLPSRRRQSASDILECTLYSVLQTLSRDLPLQSLCDDNGNTLVHWAICRKFGDKRAAIVAKLLHFGLDCNHQNYDGERPLLQIAASGDLKTAKVLLNASTIQVNASCALGVTAVHAAANAGDAKMLRILCDAGAILDKRDDNKWTALHYAAACCSGLETLFLLCELLTDQWIDAQCSEGNTALHVAAGCGCLGNVRALLETAANPNIINLRGESAYHVALRNHHIQCAVAINEYQKVPLRRYTVPFEKLEKDRTFINASLKEKGDRDHLRVEGHTEDGHFYVYSTMTTEASWNKLEECQQVGTRTQFTLDEQSDEPHSYSLATHDLLGITCGQQLPLCLIPMVSPLLSLDHPTAAAKYEEARRKARKQRRCRQLKLKMSTGLHLHT